MSDRPVINLLTYSRMQAVAMHPDLLHFTPGKAGAEKVLLAIKWSSGRKPEAEPGLLRGGGG